VRAATVVTASAALPDNAGDPGDAGSVVELDASVVRDLLRGKTVTDPDPRGVAYLPGPRPDDRSGARQRDAVLRDDDPSVELHASSLAGAGISDSELLPWSAYSWYAHE
jgi:hypothetical protein